MNNGGFSIFPTATLSDEANSASGTAAGRRRKSQTLSATAHLFMPDVGQDDPSNCWNAREEVRLLDAVEQYGYGNWKVCKQKKPDKCPDVILVILSSSLVIVSCGKGIMRMSCFLLACTGHSWTH